MFSHCNEILPFSFVLLPLPWNRDLYILFEFTFKKMNYALEFVKIVYSLLNT